MQAEALANGTVSGPAWAVSCKSMAIRDRKATFPFRPSRRSTSWTVRTEVAADEDSGEPQDPQVVGEIRRAPGRQPGNPRGRGEEAVADGRLKPPEEPLPPGLAAAPGEGRRGHGLEAPGVGHDVDNPVGQVDAIARGRHALELDAQQPEQVADRLARAQAHEGGRPGVERVGASPEIAGTASELGVCLQERRTQPGSLRQRGRRQAPHPSADHDQVVHAIVPIARPEDSPRPAGTTRSGQPERLAET